MWFFQAFTANASHRDRLLFPYFLALWIHQIMVICPTWYTRNEDGKTNCKCPGSVSCSERQPQSQLHDGRGPM